MKYDNQPVSYDPKNDLCVDASLWVSFLTTEKKSEEVSRIFELWFESCDFFIAPSLLIFELTSALHKKIGNQLMSRKDATHILADFYEHPILLFQQEELSNLSLDAAHEMKMTYPYDASYVALARWKKVPFYTADVELYNKAKKIYPACHLV